MIIDAIVGLLFTLVTGVLSLFPTFSLGSQFTGAGGFGALVAGANAWFPLSTLGLCIAAVIGARLFVIAVKLVLFVYSLVPFKAT